MSPRWKVRHAVYGGLLFLFVVNMLPYERNHYTCLRCRLYKGVVTYCGLPFTFHRRNVCSSWYNETYPDHIHDWRRSGCTYRRSGGVSAFLCPRLHPVFRIKPLQYLSYLKAHSPEARDELFRLMDSQVREDNERARTLVEDFLESKDGSSGENQPGQQGAIGSAQETRR